VFFFPILGHFLGPFESILFESISSPPSLCGINL